MLSFYNSVYLSPHLDDAILSCGGQIYNEIKANHSALIVTITAGDPTESQITNFANSLHERWKTPEKTVAIRREEDVKAINHLGAHFLHWGLLDCIYRQDPHTGLFLYPSEESLFGPIQPGDIIMRQRLSQLIANLPQWDSLVVPLAVGNHVDHRLCRRAAEEIYGVANLTYYEDFPYVLSGGIEETLTNDKFQWDSSIVGLAKAAIRYKVEAIAFYDSQLSSFFESKSDMVKQVEAFHREVGGERFWRAMIP